MAWQGTKTWGAGPWPFSDANTYIRDNMVSIRRYQTVPQFFTDQQTATTTLTTQGSHTSLCGSTPDEATRLLVMVFLQAFSPSANLTLTVNLRDQTNTSILSQGVGVGFPVQTSGADSVPGMPLAGGSLHASGVNPGFNLTLQTSTGTCTVRWTAIAMVVPQT